MSKPNFTDAVKLEIAENQNWKCWVCNDRIYEIHHILSNSKMNYKIYGVENIESRINGIGLCRKHHEHHSLFTKPLRKQLEKDFKSKSKIKKEAFNYKHTAFTENEL